MNPPRNLMPLAATLLAVAALAGCALPPAGHDQHTTASAATPGGGMDMKAMCERHRQMMQSPSVERRAMMEERMKAMGMNQEAMHKHMQEMAQRCK